jgi:molybdopterin-containing oxidoreductase family membrane subunit
VLVVVAAYFVLVENAHRLYAHESRAAAMQFLFGGGHALLFWGGLILMGTIAPAAILFRRATGQSIRWVAIAAALVVAGVLCERYLIVIPGLSYPPDLFPGWTITKSPIEEGIVSYSVSLHELLQALGVVALLGLLFLWGLRTLRLLPSESGRG